MHEDMHQQADRERQQKRQAGKQMHAVLEGERQTDACKHDAHRHAEGRAQKSRDTATSGLRGSGMFRHFLTSSLARFYSSELPMTESEVAVMAITPIIGCSSPTAATGMAARL